MNVYITEVRQNHLSALKTVLDSSGLFPSDLLDPMIYDYFNNSDSEEIWFTALLHNQPISIGYCAPERLTQGTYNLYAIAVHASYQGQGIGLKMMEYIEKRLAAQGHRLLLVETSGKAEYALTRAFYHQCLYTQQAIIPDFYDEGDDKIIFIKKFRGNSIPPVTP